MSLNPGDRLGSYEVIAPLGKGGMGEVYRARDTTLDRDVAIKVLSAQFTADPDRLVRFEREAKVLASLNHPNIAAIYGIELEKTSGAVSRALVMELVEGKDLSEVIQGAQSGQTLGISLKDALAIARQIADALEAAHDLGIVHRDLKPANVMVRDDGTVKVLDFGLAKALTQDSGPGTQDSANSPTLTARATQLGMILGTAAYMAPEQAKGKSVDKRADNFAFGAVLFEMLTGRRAFDGDDVSDIMASVLKSEPDYDKLPADTPPAVRRFMTRCLEKDPRRRLRDIGEAMRQLDEAIASPPPDSRATMASTPEPAPLWRRIAPVGAAIVATALLTTAVWWSLVPAEVAPGLMKFAAPADVTSLPVGRDIAVSPDGRLIVYQAPPGLAVRAMDQLEGVVIDGGETAGGAFFSADSAWIGFVDGMTGGDLLKIPAMGGPRTKLAHSDVSIFGAGWASSGEIVFGSTAGLFRVVEGGVPTPVTTVGAGENGHFWPTIVESAGVAFFTVSTAQGAAAVSLSMVSLSSGVVTPLGINGSSPKYLPTGHLAYVTDDGVLRAVPFDIGTAKVTGSPVPLVPGVQVKVNGEANFDVSAGGMLAFIVDGASALRNTLVWVKPDGSETEVGTDPRGYFYPRVSPDGSKVAVDLRDQEEDIWIWDVALRQLRQLTFGPSQELYPVWTTDSRRVVFASGRGGGLDVYVQNADGTGAVERLTATPVYEYPSAVLPDGSGVIVRAQSPAGGDIATLALDGSGTERMLLGSSDFDERNAVVSPKGRWMAYQSAAPGGASEVFVTSFPDVGSSSWQVSISGGEYPVWSSDESKLFYLRPDGMMMTVSLKAGATFQHDVPQPLFDASGYFLADWGRNFDLAPDGRFLMVKPVPRAAGEAAAVPAITVILNWFTDVKAKAPVK